MKKAASTEANETAANRDVAIGAGSQTLMRGLDVIEAVAAESLTLGELADRLGLTKSTAYRLASALVERGYLAATSRAGYLAAAPRAGYRLGPKLLTLGNAAQTQADLIQIARPFLEVLSGDTEDTVHLGILSGDHALYLDKQPGRRRITISSQVGERQPLSSTGLGKALMLDLDEGYWRERLAADRAAGGPAADVDLWISRMRDYVKAGRAYDLEENEDQIRCVAAPVRDASGKIVAAISVSSAAQYMRDDRMVELSGTVVACADAISRELGWTKSAR